MKRVLEKSRKIAIWVYNLYKYLFDEKNDYKLSKKSSKSDSSTGINLNEALYSLSRNEFLFNATISSKECAETDYLLNLPKETDLPDSTEDTGLISDCEETLRLLMATRKTLEKLQRAVNRE